MSTDTQKLAGEHHMRVDLVRSAPKCVLIVVANPSVATTVGWPIGFWGAELTHPYYELTERGFEVTIASPDGGEVKLDTLSDPRDPSKWSAEDLITRQLCAGRPVQSVRCARREVDHGPTAVLWP